MLPEKTPRALTRTLASMSLPAEGTYFESCKVIKRDHWRRLRQHDRLLQRAVSQAGRRARSRAARHPPSRRTPSAIICGRSARKTAGPNCRVTPTVRGCVRPACSRGCWSFSTAAAASAGKYSSSAIARVIRFSALGTTCTRRPATFSRNMDSTIRRGSGWRPTTSIFSSPRRRRWPESTRPAARTSSTTCRRSSPRRNSVPEVERILFDPNGLHADCPGLRRVGSWRAIEDYLFGVSE